MISRCSTKNKGLLADEFFCEANFFTYPVQFRRREEKYTNEISVNLSRFFELESVDLKNNNNNNKNNLKAI